MFSFSDEPRQILINIAKEQQWSICEQFCKIFNISFVQCLEYAGDDFLKKKNVRHALQCYNIAKVLYSFENFIEVEDFNKFV